ncbi:MAG: HAMP domain-containing histidine kinase [Myxococcales bacterium]|nr:HAMP domain-containing histidine kinase [Myxococcales bacterium]
MTIAVLDRLLSLGQSDAIPDRLARHVRVTNALALLGAAMSFGSTPLDAVGAPFLTVVVDLAATAAFVSCLLFNRRRHYFAARVMLMLTANAAILAGVLQVGAVAELRTVFFPLVLLPFLVLGTSERGWLFLFVAIPIAGYFVTGTMDPPPPGLAMTVYRVYAPVLTFTMIAAGSAVFTHVERNAEARLLQARARAAQGARLVALGEMSSGIAHEIKNPLAAIHLAATQIAERPDQPTLVAQLGEQIKRIVMRASRIIDALRLFSRDASADPFVAAPVERILGDALELCGKRFTEHGIDLVVDPVPTGLEIECRHLQISQVLVNLLGNAYDAVAVDSVSERWVRIEVHADRDRLELAVTDSGAGVPAAAQARIFEPFFTTKGPDRGTGIGLSLSRGLVAAHHGTLELDTESRNTRFVIRIPMVQPPR